MLKYTTGELAKLCNVSVRTVQFYDTKNLLKPSEISEGGRRLYTQADVKKLSFICLLKTLGLNLEAIKQILEHADSNNIILSILDEQLKQLKLDIDEKQNQIQTIKLVQQNICQSRTISFQSIQDIEHIRKGQKKLRTVHLFMLGIGMIMSSIEIVSIVLWVVNRNWIPFAVGMPIVILLGCLLTTLYYQSIAFICPTCSTVFKPKFKEFFFAMHTPKATNLTCPQCRKKNWCVESYHIKSKTN